MAETRYDLVLEIMHTDHPYDTNMTHQLALELADHLRSRKGLEVQVHNKPGGMAERVWTPDEGEDAIQHLASPDWLVYVGLALAAGPALKSYADMARLAVEWLKGVRAAGNERPQNFRLRVRSKRGSIDIDLDASNLEEVIVNISNDFDTESGLED